MSRSIHRKFFWQRMLRHRRSKPPADSPRVRFASPPPSLSAALPEPPVTPMKRSVTAAVKLRPSRAARTMGTPTLACGRLGGAAHTAAAASPARRIAAPLLIGGTSRYSTDIVCIAVENRARICKPFKEPRNRLPAWRNRFLCSLNVYKFGLWSLQLRRFSALISQNMYITERQ
jgi:hypothetical protein